MKMLSNEKNLANPWYLFSLIEKNQEKKMIRMVPTERAI
jgi:hypothetical protein